MRVIGIISGTSFDAVEVAAAKLHLEDETVVMRPLGSISVDYEPDLRSAVAGMLPPAATSAEAVCKLDTRLGQAFAEAAVQAANHLLDGPADLVVSHGQTVYHWVENGKALGTLQLGQPAWIAEHTGVPVVSDLRGRDVAAGGHGAPLVSLFDVLLLERGPETRAALNLGGIANLTIVPEKDSPFAFDVGPANALIDAAVDHFSGGSESYDKNGRRAARGESHRELLQSLMEDPYFDQPPPKSTGKEYFNLSYLQERLRSFGRIPDDDVVATVTRLTAETISRDLRRHDVKEVVASGGGTSNPVLMSMLQDSAPNASVRPIEDWGIPSESKEAYAFAVLGFLTLHGLPGTVPACTGARRARVLGNITPGEKPLVLPDAPESNPTRLRISPPEG
ncbi:MAG: anhydro-N-acetylmuramic acid kinase [Rubrobacteraceae bacterium]